MPKRDCLCLVGVESRRVRQRFYDRTLFCKDFILYYLVFTFLYLLRSISVYISIKGKP